MLNLMLTVLMISKRKTAFKSKKKLVLLPGISDLFLLSPSRMASTIADIIVRTGKVKYISILLFFFAFMINII